MSSGQAIQTIQDPTHAILNIGHDLVLKEKDDQIQVLLQNVKELVHLLDQKEKDIKELQWQLHSRELGLEQFAKAMDETCRRKSDVEDKLTAASRENFNLRFTKSILEGRIKDSNNELKLMEQKLLAEKETERILCVEKNIMEQKYKELFTFRKKANDQTFMHMYDEHICEECILQDELLPMTIAMRISI